VRVPLEAQPEQVRLQRTVGKTTRLHHQPSWHRSQPREDLRHHQYESSHLHQRCPEAYRVHGGLEQIHLKAWRTGATLLQTTQASREVRVDSRGRSSSRSAQGFPIQATSPHGSLQKAAATALSRCNYSSAMVVERQEDGHAYPVQRPVYFISEVLSESKARYQPV
jgi:hypothetical protein